MNRRLAMPYPAHSERPFWVSKGWTSRRRAATGAPGTGSEGTEPEGAPVEEEEDDDANADTGGGNEETVSRAEHERTLERMRAADRAKSEAEKKLQEIADKDKSELERANQKVTELTEANSKLAEENGRLKMENAFNNVPDVKFKKPGTALKVAQAEGFLEDVLDNDGSVNVKIFNKKVGEFAKANPELLMSGSGAPAPTPPSGGGVGTGGRGGSNNDLEKTVREKHAKLLR